MQKMIKIIDGAPQIVEDGWIVARAEPSGAAMEIVPFPCWRQAIEAGKQPPRGIWLAPDDEFEAYADRFGQLTVIAVDFPSFRDGRGYSTGYLLRSRYGWKGELRAIGDVLRDQLNYMRRCGFDAFALRADKDAAQAIKSFSRYTVQYQGAIDQPLPLFRRRPAA